MELEERRLAFEEERLLLENEKSREQNKFFSKHFGAIITAAVTLATVSVSGAQVWVAYINKNKELSVTELQKKQELDSTNEERIRRWKLDVAEFIFEKRKLIFSDEANESKQIRNVMLATFPLDVTERIFLKIEAGASDEQKEIWAEGQKAIDRASLAGEGSSPIDDGSGDLETVSEGTVITSDVLNKMVEDFAGQGRRNLSINLANMYKKKPREVIEALTQGILPDDDRWSYRVNIYIARTLERIKPSWTGTTAQLAKIQDLKNSLNYRDETFQTRVNGAICNFEKSECNSAHNE